MSHQIIREELAAAEREMVKDFGEIYRNYTYDHAILRQLRSLGFQPKAIYDVGSSDGIWSAMASRVFPQSRFELFEPLAEVSEDYRKSLASEPWILSLISAGSARIHPIALGAKSGSCRMTVYPHAVGSTSLELDYKPADAQIVEVPMSSLKDLIRSKNLPAPSLIKLDTQGSELDILEGAGALLSQVDAVLCECWLFQGYGSKTPLWLEVANFLASHGLFTYDTGWAYRRPTDQRTATIDILFLRHNLPFSPLKGYAVSYLE